MKALKQEIKDQRVTFNEVQANGACIQKFFTCSKKVLQWHIESMRNNPYIQGVNVIVK